MKIYSLSLNNDWVIGKSGLKCLQYMAMGIPSVSTNVGNIKNIVENGVDGYLVKTKDQSVVGSAKTISKKQATATGLGNLQIDILNAAGETIETWNLNNPFIEAAKYGDLDYSNDELRTVELTIKYDWASCTVGGSSGTSFFSI